MPSLRTRIASSTGCSPILAAVSLATLRATIPFIDDLRTRLGFDERTARIFFDCLIVP